MATKDTWPFIKKPELRASACSESVYPLARRDAENSITEKGKKYNNGNHIPEKNWYSSNTAESKKVEVTIVDALSEEVILQAILKIKTIQNAL
jgi:hypothetical protein